MITSNAHSPETAQSLKSYLLADSEAGVDVNHDGTVNIFDLIEYKAAALDIDIPEGAFKLSSIPKYSGTPYAVVNNNVPFFRYKGYTECFEYYTELDSLGRCGTAIALVGKETMSTEPRGEIGMVRPSGWHTYKYAAFRIFIFTTGATLSDFSSAVKMQMSET